MNLYVVGTPIGNLEDMTVRAVEILEYADVILCEDTRITRKLTTRFDISTPLKSYHDFNKDEVEDDIIRRMTEGEVFALVSDAGMPVISDPGYELIKRMQEEMMEYAVIPGPSAFTLALVASGLPSYDFTFFGFLPKSSAKQKEKLREIMHHPHTSVLYESPHQIRKTIAQIASYAPDRRLSISREITKKFEQHAGGTVAEIADRLEDDIPMKGEFVIVIEGYEEGELESDMPLKDHVAQFIDDGMKPKQAIKMVADIRGMKKQTVYDAFHKS